jgi:Guanine nucleotide exchange factor synembryn
MTLLQCMCPVSTGGAARCELLASSLGAIRIMLREAEGSAELLTESAVQLYLRSALESEDATSGFKVAYAGLACLLNAVLLLEATQAPLPKATTAVLLSLLGEERPVSILHLAARILYRVCATRTDASAELRKRCLPTVSESQGRFL